MLSPGRLDLPRLWRGRRRLRTCDAPASAPGTPGRAGPFAGTLSGGGLIGGAAIQRATADVGPASAAASAEQHGSAGTSPRSSAGRRVVRTAGHLLSHGPVGLPVRPGMGLDSGGGNGDGDGRCTLHVPLHAGLRLDLVRLALGLGPVSLRRLGAAPVAPGRPARVLGRPPACGDPARARALPPPLTAPAAPPACDSSSPPAQSPVGDLTSPYQPGRGGPGGWWILPEPGIAMPGSREFSPDVAGWRRERLPALPDTKLTLAPDWLCEIHSTRTRGYDMRVKRPFYAEIGVEWLWYVDDAARA